MSTKINKSTKQHRHVDGTQTTATTIYVPTTTNRTTAPSVATILQLSGLRRQFYARGHCSQKTKTSMYMFFAVCFFCICSFLWFRSL